MRVLPEPEYGELSVSVAMELGRGGRCTAAAGTTVEVIGTTTDMAASRVEVVLVRALTGPCAGATASVEARLLRDVRATPVRARP
jgi:ribosomal protein L2